MDMEKVCQIDGDHYTKMKIQPLEYIVANEMPFLEGSVVKYVSRHRSKGGRIDIEKAITCLEAVLLTYDDDSVDGDDIQDKVEKLGQVVTNVLETREKEEKEEKEDPHRRAWDLLESTPAPAPLEEWERGTWKFAADPFIDDGPRFHIPLRPRLSEEWDGTPHPSYHPL